MSGGRFASLTAGLLVRKGEARPSTIVTPAFSLARMSDWVPERLDMTASPAQAEPPAPPPKPRSATPPGGPPPPGDPPPTATPAKPRRLMVTLTPAEHETLGLIAVKKAATRHQLLRNALDEYMALLVEEYGGDCQCIYTGVSCDNSCGNGV